MHEVMYVFAYLTLAALGASDIDILVRWLMSST